MSGVDLMRLFKWEDEEEDSNDESEEWEDED